ncbi:hypothetical protein N9571_06255, partial [Yoonia sp.]|nr:hypothetical protein [Yoonia sp.]
LKKVLDADYEIITGFKGLTDIEAAIDRGELDGYCGSQFDRFIRNHQGETRQLIGSLTVPLEQDGVTLPAIIDFISDEKDITVASIFATARDSIYYPVMMSPGVSPEAVDRHRQAFDAMVKDEAFLDEAADIYLYVSPMSGEEVEAAVAGISALDPDDVALLNQYLQ